MSIVFDKNEGGRSKKFSHRKTIGSKLPANFKKNVENILTPPVNEKLREETPIDITGKEILNIYGPPGIGDLYWMLVKILPNLKENQLVKLHSYRRNGFASKFLKKLKGIYSVEEFDPHGIDFWNEAVKLYPKYTKIEDNMKLFPNPHLEMGNRIEDYLPFLPMKFKLEWNFNQELYDMAIRKYIKSNRPNIIIYTSTKVNNRVFRQGKWTQGRWIELIKGINNKYPTANIIWIGASYDKPMFDHIRKFFSKVTGLVDEEPEVIMALLRNCDCFVSYQSGLSVLSVCEEIPTCMLYFDELTQLRNSWVPPTSINNNAIYFAPTFSEVDSTSGIKRIVNWVIDRCRERGK